MEYDLFNTDTNICDDEYEDHCNCWWSVYGGEERRTIYEPAWSSGKALGW